MSLKNRRAKYDLYSAQDASVTTHVLSAALIAEFGPKPSAAETKAAEDEAKKIAEAKLNEEDDQDSEDDEETA